MLHFSANRRSGFPVSLLLLQRLHAFYTACLLGSNFTLAVRLLLVRPGRRRYVLVAMQRCSNGIDIRTANWFLQGSWRCQSSPQPATYQYMHVCICVHCTNIKVQQHTRLPSERQILLVAVGCCRAALAAVLSPKQSDVESVK